MKRETTYQGSTLVSYFDIGDISIESVASCNMIIIKNGLSKIISECCIKNLKRMSILT